MGDTMEEKIKALRDDIKGKLDRKECSLHDIKRLEGMVEILDQVLVMFEAPVKTTRQEPKKTKRK